MPWHCPACQSIIKHSDFEVRPRAGERYRCHVCRLELMLSPKSDTLVVTPLDQPVESVDRRRTGQGQLGMRRRRP